jgi:hypothetical protein
MSGPGPTKTPINMYVTRQHKANLKREAVRRGVPMTQVILDLLDEHGKKVEKLYGKPKPAPVYKAPWLAKYRAKVKAARKKAA